MPPRDPSIGYLVHWAGRLLRRLADRRLEPLGLSSGHLPVLTTLLDRGALSQKALAEAAEIEQPTMAATLARMERDGIVRREPDPNDKRSSLFSLAPAMQKKLGALRDVIESINTDALAALPKEDRARFTPLLKAMIAGLERKLEE
jgi:DNA-binding MarR family transcriptional regulator